MRSALRSVMCVAAIALVPAAAAIACVDGVTPDCSDPKVQCGPDLDGSADRPETGNETGAPDTSSPDVSQPDPDAGDEI